MSTELGSFFQASNISSMSQSLAPKFERSSLELLPGAVATIAFFHQVALGDPVDIAPRAMVARKRAPD